MSVSFQDNKLIRITAKSKLFYYNRSKNNQEEKLRRFTYTDLNENSNLRYNSGNRRILNLNCSAAKKDNNKILYLIQPCLNNIKKNKKESFQKNRNLGYNLLDSSQSDLVKNSKFQIENSNNFINKSQLADPDLCPW